MNAPIQTAKRRCSRCYEWKSPTCFEYRPSTVEGMPGSYRGTCRICRKERLKKEADGTTRLRDYIPGPKPCRLCCSLPWRITGLRCPECGLECATEPRPEMRLRRFDRVG